MGWCILIDAISINEYSIRPTLYEISTVIIFWNKSSAKCVNKLASDLNGPGSTPGGTLKLDTGYHPFMGR